MIRPQYIAFLAILKRLREWLSRNTARVSQNGRCPGCGARRGHIRFDPEESAIIHTCHVCDAVWSEDPVIPAEEWNF